jgi:hypothetical protein
MISLYVPDLWEHFKVSKLLPQEERIMPVFYSSSWFITLFTNAMQYTTKSYLVTWIVDFTIAEGIKGLLKCMIVLLKYLRFKFCKMSFEQIMNFLSDLTKKELFTNVLYDTYLKEKAKGENEESLRNKYIMFYEDFKFLNFFRDRVNGMILGTTLILSLENKYEMVKKKIDSKL